MTKQDIIEYVMNTPHNTNKAVLSSMLNQLTEDGGGSSDFSTATVTKIDENVALYACCVDSAGSTTISYANPETVILYKGKAIVDVQGGVPILDGAIEYDSATGMCVITGDCTIGISSGGVTETD